MAYRCTVRNQTYRFDDLKTLLAKATPLRSGDQLAGVAAQTAEERVAAQMALADLPLTTFLNETVVPYETDEITRLILDTHDANAFAPISHLTVGDLRNYLLSDEVDSQLLSGLQPGLTPEMVAAVSKLMRNQDLITVSAKCEVITRFRDTIGLKGRFSTRLQPNHPTDDFRGVAASIVDGLFYGSGDAVIGINPATDHVRTVVRLVDMMDQIRQRFEIPTQTCVLSHITTTLQAIEQGAPVDLMFQSIGGTEAVNASFGINLSLLREGLEATRSLKRGTVGRCRPMPTTASISKPARFGRMPWPGFLNLCWSIPSSVLSGRSIYTTENKSFVPVWKTIAAGNCWACRWASTSVIRTTPKPIRTIWTRYSRCSARRASTLSWAFRVPTT
jgi:ethanolamine ammonia-lyase large subunit